MHLSDGILTLPVAAACGAGAAGLVYRGIRDIDRDNLAPTSAMAALFFLASFIHIPFGPTQIHLMLSGIIGVLLGWPAAVSICIALILQALLLGYGGLVSLGANILIMALPALLVYQLYHRLAPRFHAKKGILFFGVGFLSSALSAAILALLLFLSKKSYGFAALSVLAANVPAMLVEGVVTMFLMLFLHKTMPGLLHREKRCV